MPRRLLALFITAVQAVIALAPVALCEECGSQALAFNKAECRTCKGCGNAGVASASDSQRDDQLPNGLQRQCDDDRAIVFGNGEAATAQDIVTDVAPPMIAAPFVIVLSPIDLPLLAEALTEILPLQLGACPGAGAPALRC